MNWLYLAAGLLCLLAGSLFSPLVLSAFGALCLVKVCGYALRK